MIAQQDQEMIDWLINAVDPRYRAGGFIRAIADAALRADWENYDILRPALMQLKDKYPEYAAKQKYFGNITPGVG